MNLYHPDCKRNKQPACNADPSTVTTSQRIKELPSQDLRVSAGKLFCQSCHELSLQKSIVQGHIASTTHAAGKERKARKEKRERDIAEAFQKYDKQIHLSGKTLSESVWVYHVRVLSTFFESTSSH